MIRSVAPNEASQVFDLMDKVYADHSFLDQGVDNFQAQLENGAYVSLGDFDEEGTLQAHAGYKVHPEFALINALVVDPSKRGAGLGRSVFEARLDHIIASQTFDFIVGYSMMQHLGSQKLYSDTFKPIGIDIGYPDIYHQNDSKYNRGNASNAEIVLCQRISSRDYRAELSLDAKDQDLARRIFDSLGVTCKFGDDAEQIHGETFLGFHPDVKRGLFLPTFLGHTAAVDFDPLLASNSDRQAFVDVVKENYERNTIS